MIRTGLFLFLLACCGICSAQDTHFAQFVIKGELETEQVVTLTTELGKLPGVMQARVGRQNQNVVISSMPGVPILEREIQQVMESMELEMVCMRQGVVGKDRILFVDEECRERRSQGNIQD